MNPDVVTTTRAPADAAKHARDARTARSRVAWPYQDVTTSGHSSALVLHVRDRSGPADGSRPGQR